MSHDLNDFGSLTIDQDARLSGHQDADDTAYSLREEADRELRLTCAAYEDEIVRLKHMIEAYEVEKVSAFGFLKPDVLAKGFDQEKIRTAFSWTDWLREREALQQTAIDTGKAKIAGLERRVDELEREVGRQKAAFRADLDNARLQHDTAYKDALLRHSAELKAAEARRQTELRSLSESSAESLENLHLEMLKLRSELLVSQEKYRKEAYRMAAVIALRTKQLEEAQGAARAAQSQVTALYASRSWRFGKFVRGLGRAARSVLRRTRAHA